MMDNFGDRMKGYESLHSHKITSDWVCARIDGRSFSKFTKKLEKEGLLQKPRDEKFENVFKCATAMTMEHFGFKFGFHQSDEVSLYFNPTNLDNVKSEHLFGGKIQKLTSVIASFFTSAFIGYFSEVYNIIPAGISFDCRIIEFPNMTEAVNMLVWRWQDAERNLITDIANHKFGNKILVGVPTTERYKMIGSPNLNPGNFLKKVNFYNETGVLRSRVAILKNIKFREMSFKQRVDLVYGEKSDY